MPINNNEGLPKYFYLTKHLEESLREGQDYLFTVMIAPDGFGKTTTARYCVSRETRFVCWLDFTEGREQVWVKMLDGLNIHDGHGLIREKPFYIPKMGKVIFQHVMMQVGGIDGGVLVFDHYEKGRNRQTDSFMEILMDDMPRSWHVFLMDSGGLKAKAPQWGMTGKVHFLTPNDLMFHLEDIFRYFCDYKIRASITELMGVFELSRGAIGEISKIMTTESDKDNPLNSLTPRELEIAAYAAAGLTNREISHTLYISENTVKTTLKNVYEKLDIHTKRHLIAMFHREAIPLTGGGRV